MSAIIYLERGTTKIAIATEKIEEFLENKIIKIAIPRVGNNTNVPVTRYKDLKKLNHVFNIQGAVYAQQSENANADFYDSIVRVKGATDTLSATQAKNAIIYYILYPDSATSGNIKLYWRGLPSTTATEATPLFTSGDDNLSLMNSIDTNRSVSVVFEKINFQDASATLKDIVLSALFDHTTQVDAKKYTFNATLVKGVTF